MASEPPERFVALFDILGYQDLVRKQSPSIVLDRMVKTWSDFPLPVDGYGRREADVFHYADTSIAYTEGCKHADLENLLLASSRYAHELIAGGMGVRCAVVRGPLEVRREPFTAIAGAALIDAFDLEREQDWVGGMIDAACFNGPKEGCNGDCTNLARPYMIPFKTRTAKLELALDWTVWEVPHHSDVTMALDSVHEIYRQADRPWDVVRKWKNSAEFLASRRADASRARPSRSFNRWNDNVVMMRARKPE